jgi:hypothetical protein
MKIRKNGGRQASGQYQWREAYACCDADSNTREIKSLAQAATVPLKNS